MTNVAGHLREQNGMYQMILSWKDAAGFRPAGIGISEPLASGKRDEPSARNLWQICL